MSDCLFCKIKTNELQIKKIAENERAIAFLDAYPTTYGHCLVVPKEHFANLVACDNATLHDAIDLTKVVAEKLINLNVGIKGFNYLSNHNEIAGQVIMHFHLHIIPKYEESKGFKTISDKLENDPILEAKIKSLIIE